MSTKQKHLFLKSPNLKFNPVVHSHSLPRRLRIADILLADQDHDGVDCMDAFRETSTKKCFSPLRLVESLLAPLRPAKGVRLQQRRRNETGELHAAPTPTNELKGSDDSIENPAAQLHESDTSFKLGVVCGLLYLLAASKNELGKMVELRKEMEVLLQNMKGELQRKDALLKPLKQNDALALSITDIQEVSSSDSHISIHSQTQYVQPESKRNMVPNNFLEYNISEQGECAEEINDLQAEFEIELQRLQLYLDGETESEDAKHEGVKVTVKDVKDCSSKSSHSSSFGEITMEPIGASYDVSFGVSPIELERRLHELLEARLEERITELEYGLECTTQKLMKKEIEATWWKDTARLLSQHVPETSRFTFPLDPEIAVNLSKFIG